MDFLIFKNSNNFLSKTLKLGNAETNLYFVKNNTSGPSSKQSWSCNPRGTELQVLLFKPLGR